MKQAIISATWNSSLFYSLSCFSSFIRAFILPSPDAVIGTQLNVQSCRSADGQLFSLWNLSCQFWMLWLDSVCVCHTLTTLSPQLRRQSGSAWFRSPCRPGKFLGTELRQSYNHSASRIYFPSFKDHCSLFLMTRVLWTIVPYEEMFVCFRINSLIVIPRNGESGEWDRFQVPSPFLQDTKVCGFSGLLYKMVHPSIYLKASVDYL